MVETDQAVVKYHQRPIARVNAHERKKNVERDENKNRYNDATGYKFEGIDKPDMRFRESLHAFPLF